MLLYERSLDQDADWALSEGSRFFEGTSAVQSALYKITRRLEEMGIPYAIVGGMALFSYGYRRFTEDVDILVKPEDLKEIHQQLAGRGYRPPFRGSKNLRDTDSGVRIEFLVTGQFPGDGKPKPIAFPAPESVSIVKDGIRYLNLSSLIELKLASGVSSTDRMRDLVDVQELIKLFDLTYDFGETLNDFVKEKYVELWNNVHQSNKRYMTLWRNKFLTTEAKTIDDMAKGLREAAELLEAMIKDGVQLDPEGGTSDDYSYLFTTDPEVAKKYDMHEEAEFWGEDILEEGDDLPGGEQPDPAP